MHWTMNLLLSLVLLLTSCSRDHSRVFEEKKEVVVDRSAEERLLEQDRSANKNLVLLLLPLSGSHAEIGRSVLNACMLFSYEHGNSDANFCVVDTSDPNVNNYRLYEKYKHADLKGIIGPVFFNEAKQFGALFPKTRIFTLSNNIKANNNHVFSCGISPQDEICTVFSYAKDNNIHDFLVMLPENELGDQLLEYVNRESAEHGFNDENVEIVRYKSMSRKNAMKIVRDSEKDAVFLVDPVLNPQNLDDTYVFTLGISAFANREVWTGAYFAFSKNQQLDDFSKKYKETFGSAPGPLSIVGYDLCNLLHDSLMDGTDRDSFYAEHEGCLGSFSIEKNKGIRRKLSIVRIGDDETLEPK
ncbi:hypothetical protein FACS189449_03210 [Alphaproteobacteria bacterium]|nr:hypothetical protein FACS189449_03210 [Alphaproteobacteria bacterium]